MRSIPQYEVYTSIRCIYLNTLQIPKLLVMGLWSWDLYFHGGRIAVQFRIAVKLGSVKLGLAKFWLWEWDEVRCSGWSSWPAKKKRSDAENVFSIEKKRTWKNKSANISRFGSFSFRWRLALAWAVKGTTAVFAEKRKGQRDLPVRGERAEESLDVWSSSVMSIPSSTFSFFPILCLLRPLIFSYRPPRVCIDSTLGPSIISH